MFIPDALWQIVKTFLFTRPMCLLCKTEKTKVCSFTNKVLNKSGLTNRGQHLCRCVRNSSGSFTFYYACHGHYALNTSMKLTLARKEMFHRAREVATPGKVGTKELRTNICVHLTKQDLMRLLCSKRSKGEIGKEVLTLCKIEL